MVLKNFINYLINKYLKNYVEKLDYEKLKLGLSHGNIYLENLYLKPDALAYLNIPATVAVGFIEKLKVTIPWNSLSNHPTEVQIDGFYLLIVPKAEKTPDLTELYAEKMKRVELKVEHLRKALSGDGSYDNKELAFLERMRIQMMQNLVIRIRNFHVSYEMKSPLKLGHPFSFGMTMHHLEVSTANFVKSHKRVKGNTLLTYKIKEMNSLSIYWVTQCKSRLEMPFEAVLNDLKSKIATKDYTPMSTEIKYILYPTNLRSESLITLRPKEHHYERSTLLFDIQLEEVHLHIDPQQISDILDFLKLQNYTTIYDRCREYRELLLQHLINKRPLTSEQRKRLQYLELKLDIFHLAFNRHRVDMEMARLSAPKVGDIPVEEDQQPVRNHQTSEGIHHTLSKHLNRWDSLSKIKNNLASLSKKDHRKSSSASSHQRTEKQMSFEDRPYIDAQIFVRNAFLNLTSKNADMRYSRSGGKDEILASIHATNGEVSVKKMCVSSRIECSVSLESGEVLGIESDKEGKDDRPVILRPKNNASSSLLQIELILFPENRRSDYQFYLTIEPLELLYHGPTFNQFVESFESNGSLVWQSQTEIESRTDEDLERDLSLVKIFDMNICLKASSILIPECGVLQKNFAIVRMDLGDLIFRSVLDEHDEHADPQLFKENLRDQRFYTKYKLEIPDLRLIYFLSDRKRLFVLRPTPLISFDFYQSIDFNHSRLANWRMAIKVVMGEIQLSEKLLTALMLHFKSVPLIYSNIASIIQRINHYFTLFPPKTTLIVDLAIYNATMRLLIHPPRSIRADLQVSLLTKKHRSELQKEGTFELKDIVMTRNALDGIQQSSRSFYRRDHLGLAYSNNLTSF